MSETGKPRRLRAVLAVLALYALVLQAVLGGIAALPAGPATDALPIDRPCLQGGDDRGTGSGAPHGPAHPQAGCCTAANLAADASPPHPAAVPVVWPPRPVGCIVRFEAVRAARVPPGAVAEARGPPVV